MYGSLVGGGLCIADCALRSHFCILVVMAHAFDHGESWLCEESIYLIAHTLILHTYRKTLHLQRSNHIEPYGFTHSIVCTDHGPWSMVRCIELYTVSPLRQPVPQ